MPANATIQAGRAGSAAWTDRSPQAEQAGDEEHEVREDVRGVGDGAERPTVGERVVGGILRQGRQGPRRDAGGNHQPQQDGARHTLAVGAL